MKSIIDKSQKGFNKLIGFLILSLFLTLVFLAGVLNAQEELRFGDVETSSEQIMVVTNRLLIESTNEHLTFDSKLNDYGVHHYLSAQQIAEQYIYQSHQSLSNLVSILNGNKDLLVFIHGDGKTLQSAVERAKEIQDLHDVNVLVYAWPSKKADVGGIKNFKNSYSNVEKSAGYFSEFLHELSQLIESDTQVFDDRKVSLFFHSLGNYYLERMVFDGNHQQLSNVSFENLIINAAAVEQEGHRNWVEQLAFAKRIYINSNDGDISLSGLRVLTKLGRQLGESALPPYASNATYVDFTEAVGFPGSMGPSHSYYFASITEKSEKIKNYYTTIFHGEEAPLFNDALFAYEDEDATYTIQF